jgi:hypothetical protein
MTARNRCSRFKLCKDHIWRELGEWIQGVVHFLTFVACELGQSFKQERVVSEEQRAWRQMTLGYTQ